MSDSNTSGHTDIAALSAAAVAVVVSVVIAEGLFSLVNAVISLTLVLLIVAYARADNRTIWHNVTIAAVIGLAMMPAVGFLDEARLSGNFCRFLAEQFRSGELPYKAGDKFQSLVPAGHLAIGWLAFSLISFYFLGLRRKG